LPLPPQLAVPASLAFGGQPVGTTTAGRALAIKNTSASLATITDLSASGDFSVADTCTTIVAGATCNVMVYFQPTALGARAGTLTVRTLRDVEPYVVALTGTGEENQTPALELSVTHVGFGDAFIGSASRVSVQVRNVGQAAVTIDSILPTGSFFVTHNCTQVSPGSSCTVDVTFMPGTTGRQLGAVEIRSNAAGSPHRIDLSGVGCLVPSPSRARLGLLLCGP
jgi:hypothetical protein